MCITLFKDKNNKLRDQATLSVKDQVVNIFGLVEHKVSPATFSSAATAQSNHIQYTDQ